MGDRISIQFHNIDTNETSVAIFSHWDGRSFLNKVTDFLADLDKWLKENSSDHVLWPLDRYEADTIAFNFIMWMRTTNYGYVNHQWQASPFSQGNYYLGKDPDDGDNSDNGNYIINIDSHGLVSIDGEQEKDEILEDDEN